MSDGTEAVEGGVADSIYKKKSHAFVISIAVFSLPYFIFFFLKGTHDYG